MATQPQFDFQRGDQLALLNTMPLESGSVPDGKSTVRVSAATARAVLRQVDSHARATRHCWASCHTIGEAINRSERTVRHALRYLESLQVLVVVGREGRSPVSIIHWGEIRTVNSRSAKFASANWSMQTKF